METEQEQTTTLTKIATPQEVTTKDPRKVEAGKLLVEFNKKKREQLKHQQQESNLQSYSNVGIGIGVTISLIIGAIVYYNYRRKPDTKIQRDEPERSRIPVRVNEKFAME